VVLLNSAAAIVVGEKADTLDEGLAIAKESIDSGAALAKLEILIKESQA
jgi:anthranilate phosphoribosyltransferase